MWGHTRVGILWWSLAGVVVGVQVAAAGSLTAEQELGKKFSMEARRQLPLIDDVEVNAYVAHLGQKIVAALGEQPFSYHFYVVRDARINAFAVPGGYVYVHAGLLTAASNDDEVAGVLGHEIAHVNAHHLVRQQEATRLVNYATLLGVLLSVLNPAAGAGTVAVNEAVQLKYRREFEQEADYLGVTYVRQAGYDPGGTLDFFKKMLDQQRLTPTSAPPYLLSHPLTEARLTNLEAVLRTHQWDKRSRQPTSLDLARVQLLARARMETAKDLVESYWQQVAAHPEDAHARYLLGVAYFETGSFDAARQAFETVPPSKVVDLSRETGRTLLRLRQLEKARELLSRAAEITPDDPLAHHELAKALEALNDNDGAMREYERALQLAPDLEEAHYNLGILAGRAGRPGEGFYHLGAAFELRGEFDKALSQFKRAEPLLPPGSDRAQAVHAEVTDLSEYLKHGRWR
ncbi:MAG: M48 family metalloprotease [Candidatus Binatia bacterium]